MMTSKFGSATAWKAKFAQAFTEWSALTGIRYQEVTDDGAAFPGSPGQLGARGDVRISSHPIDGQYGILAYNYFPNTGDMVMDAGEPWANTNNDYRFMRNILAHEHGHGLGISHVCPINQTKLMEPYLALSFDGPQHDEIRAGQRNYGDRYENNDTYSSATDLGAATGTVTINNVSTDNAADNDWYRFTVSAGAQVSATLTPVGTSYNTDPQSNTGACGPGSTALNTLDDQNLDLRLYGADGSTDAGYGGLAWRGCRRKLCIHRAVGEWHVLPARAERRLQRRGAALQPGDDGRRQFGWRRRHTDGLGDGVRTERRRNLDGGQHGHGDVDEREPVRKREARTEPQLSRDRRWETIAASAANSGSYSFTLAGAATTTARVRVSGVSTPTATRHLRRQLHDHRRAATTRSLTMSAPNGGETLVTNSRTTHHLDDRRTCRAT